MSYSDVVPQVLVDGVHLGGHRSLQDLEEDGELDLICARILCPSCGAARDMDSLVCAVCQAEFKVRQDGPRNAVIDPGGGVRLGWCVNDYRRTRRIGARI